MAKKTTKNKSTPKKSPSRKRSNKRSQPKEDTPSSSKSPSRVKPLPAGMRLTCQQTADVLGCDPSNVRKLVASGKLKGTKKQPIPGSTLAYWSIDAGSVEKFLQTEQTTGYPRGKPR